MRLCKKEMLFTVRSKAGCKFLFLLINQAFISAALSVNKAH